MRNNHDHQPNVNLKLGAAAICAALPLFCNSHLRAAILCFGMALLMLTPNLAKPQQMADSLEAALKVTRQANDSVTLLNELSFQWISSNPRLAQQYAMQALALSRRTGNRLAESDALTRLGIVQKDKIHFDSAITLHSQALAIRTELRDTLLMARSLNNIGNLRRTQENWPSALQHYKTAYGLLSGKTGKLEKEELAKVCSNLGAAYRTKGEYSTSYAYYKESLDIRATAGNKIELANTHLGMGQLWEAQGMWDIAETEYKIALGHFTEAKDLRHQASTLNSLGNVARHNLDYGGAQSHYLQSLSLWQALESAPGIISLRRNMGLVETDRNNLTEAEKQFRLALELAKGEFPLQEAELLADLAFLSRSRGKLREALSQLQRAHAIVDTTELVLLRLQVSRQLADVFATLQQPDSAYHYLTKANALQDSIHQQLAKTYQLELLVESTTRREEEDKKALALQQAAQEQQSKQKRTWVMGLAIALLATMLTLVYLVMRLRNQQMQRSRAEAERKVDEVLMQMEEKTLDARLEEGQKERKRIAEDLHDGLGGLLGAIKLQFKRSDEAIQQVRLENESALSTVADLVDKALQEMRQVSQTLSHPQQELMANLRSLADAVHKSNKIAFDVHEHGMGARLTPLQEIEIFRIVKELVANALKHSDATELTLQLVRHNGSLTLTFEDNGKGFDPKGPGFQAGMGLKSIQERVQKLKGELSLDSSQGKGTTVTIQISLA